MLCHYTIYFVSEITILGLKVMVMRGLEFFMKKHEKLQKKTFSRMEGSKINKFTQLFTIILRSKLIISITDSILTMEMIVEELIYCVLRQKLTNSQYEKLSLIVVYFFKIAEIFTTALKYQLVQKQQKYNIHLSVNSTLSI